MKKRSITESALQVAVVMIFIKLTGVIKQSLIAAICGATMETDAYFVATSVIMALCSVVFSSASVSLLSMHTERLIIKGRESSNNLIRTALFVFLPISAAIMILLCACPEIVAKVLAPTYKGEQLNVLGKYIRIMSVMFVFSCYYLILNVILETDKRFIPGRAYSFIQNILICIAVLFFYPQSGISALVYAFILAGLIQCIQISWNTRKVFSLFKKTVPDRKTVHQLLTLFIPLLIGNAIYEINDIVDKQIATGLGPGNVSCLSYGASINEIVTTLIISSVSTVLFSHFATWVAEKDLQRVGYNLKKAIEWIIVLIMPVMILCYICGDYIVAILYGRGQFDGTAVLKTNGVVFGYAAGFIFQATRANLVRVYYAFQNTKIPMINGAVSIAVNIILSLLLSRVIGVGGIALATSFAMLLVTILLMPGIRKLIPGISFHSSFIEIGKALIAAVIAGSIAFGIRKILSLNIYLSFILLGTIVCLSYYYLACLFKMKTIKEMRNAIKSRLTQMSSGKQK